MMHLMEVAGSLQLVHNGIISQFTQSVFNSLFSSLPPKHCPQQDIGISE